MNPLPYLYKEQTQRRTEPLWKPICRGMLHTATHPALVTKSEIQNAKSKLDYTFVIGKARRTMTRKKKTTFIGKGKKQKKRSYYMYNPHVFHETAPDMHYSPRLSCV